MRRIIPVMAFFMCVVVSAQEAAAPYVDSKITKERFKEITAEDMEMLRGKKILFASRSFGLNLCNGLRALAKEDKRYDFLSSYQRYDVFKAGGDLSVIPADAFEKTNFVHFLASYWPHTKRVDEVDTLMREKPHEFGKKVDAVIIYFHTAQAKGVFEHYSEKMDALQADFPNVRFIYVTAGFMAPSRSKENEAAHVFSENIRKKYKGKAALYDLGAILSDDFRGGHAYVPEYSKDPAGVHPNLDAGQTMMAKGFLLVLRDAFKWEPVAFGNVRGPDSEEKKVETLPPTHPDYKAVRAILDANKLAKKKVENVAVVEDGRIVELYLQEGGISKITKDIGVLKKLRKLHLYGDRNLKLPLVTEISPAIGNCTDLEELLLNHNELKTLPKEITKLNKMKTLSIADNHLTDLPKPVMQWVEKYDPKGLKLQK